MRTALLTVIAITIASTASTTARAADADVTVAAHPYNDYLFPGNGQVAVTAATGLPYAALGEMTLGLGDRFAVGALVAGGPFVGGLATGVYPRVDALHVGPMRLVLEAPFIWYPGLQNDDNWIVFRPMARIEGETGRFRIHGDVGAMWASMVGASPVSGPIQPYGGAGLPSGVQQGSVWNTAGGGVAFALSQRTSVFAEGFLILNGVQLAGPEWFQLPCATFVGVTTAL